MLHHIQSTVHFGRIRLTEKILNQPETNVNYVFQVTGPKDTLALDQIVDDEGKTGISIECEPHRQDAPYFLKGFDPDFSWQPKAVLVKRAAQIAALIERLFALSEQDRQASYVSQMDKSAKLEGAELKRLAQAFVNTATKYGYEIPESLRQRVGN